MSLTPIKPHQINGIIMILVGIAMFTFGVSMFTYQGHNLNPDVSSLGMVCFILWLPVLIAGFATLIRKPSD